VICPITRLFLFLLLGVESFFQCLLGVGDFFFRSLADFVCGFALLPEKEEVQSLKRKGTRLLLF